MAKIVYLVNDVTSAFDCGKHSLSRIIENKREDLCVQPCLQIAPLSSCDRQTKAVCDLLHYFSLINF